MYFGTLDVTYLIWDQHAVFSKFQIWRFFTSFCFVGTWGQQGFGTLISLYLLQQYGKSLEVSARQSVRSALSLAVSLTASFPTLRSQPPQNNCPNTGGGGTVADYLVLILFCMLAHIIITVFVASRFVMGTSLMFTTLYIWCKMNFEVEVKVRMDEN